MKKSVCVDARLVGPFGIGTYLKNLLLELKTAPFTWHALVYPEHLNMAKLWDVINPIIVHSPIYSIREQLELPYKIPKSSLLWTPHYNVPLLYPGKKLITMHDVYHLAYRHKLSLLQRIYAKHMIPRVTNAADHIIVDSYFSREELLKFTGVEKEKIAVIPLGVESSHFSSESNKDDKIVHEKYGLRQPFLLFPGGYKWHKNLYGALHALDILSKQWDDLTLVILGKISKKESQKLLAQFSLLKPRLQCLEKVPEDDLPALYRNAAILLFPSFYEGFGLPPLEAMSCGCPTIVSRVAALPEVCGEATMYVDPKRPETIARAVEHLLTDRTARQSLIKRGHAWASQYCWTTCAQKHYALLERLS